MSGLRCTSCGHDELAPGFILDMGQGSKGFAQWVSGWLERGSVFGIPKIRGRWRGRVDAFRCPMCGHLELYVRDEA